MEEKGKKIKEKRKGGGEKGFNTVFGASLLHFNPIYQKKRGGRKIRKEGKKKKSEKGGGGGRAKKKRKGKKKKEPGRAADDFPLLPGVKKKKGKKRRKRRYFNSPHTPTLLELKGKKGGKRKGKGREKGERERKKTNSLPFLNPSKRGTKKGGEKKLGRGGRNRGPFPYPYLFREIPS